jgi:hypothetical protein
MTKEPLTITIDPDSELGCALDATGGSQVVLERNGAPFRVTRDPERSVDPLRSGQGAGRAAHVCRPAHSGGRRSHQGVHLLADARREPGRLIGREATSLLLDGRAA